MDNPIKYEDLFSTSLLTEIGKLKTGVGELKKELESMVVDVKKATTAINKGDTKKIDDVYKAYKKMKIELDAVNGQLEKLNGSSQNVALTQKEINKVVKLGTEYNSERADSYNALSKQYSAMKILINNMTKAERENTEEGKAMVDNARRIYEEMNRLQQSTGKFQLQVGNYSKALGGLNIATQQVIREMPVLANGMQMFVMAIGNNIPILVDQIQAFKKEQAVLAKQGLATMSVGKAMLKTIFSWQTAIVALLTVLPMLIRKINQKKKETEGLNNAMKDSLDLESALLKAQKNAVSSYAESSSKLRAMYGEAQDVNRTMEERLEIGQALIDQFPEEFEGYSKEDIVLGNAISRYKEVTETLMQQARARAYMGEITKLETARMKALLEQADAQKELDELNEKHQKQLEESAKSTEALKGGVTIATPGAEGLPVSVTGKLKEGIAEIPTSIEETKLESKIKNLGETAKKAEEDIESLKDLLNSGDFKSLFSGKKVGGGVEKEEKELPSLFDLAIKSGTSLHYGEEEEIAKLKEGFRDKMKELEPYYKDMEKLTESELASLKIVVSNYEEELARAIQEVHKKYVEKDPIAEYIKETQEWIDKEIEKMDFTYTPEEKKNPIMSLLGFEDDDKGGYSKYMKSIEKAFNLAFDYMQKWLDMRREMAHLAVESAQEEEDSAKHAMDIEMEARANGYAHNVEYARREYEEKKKIKEEALAEEQRIAQIQQKIDEAQQMSSLLVATANIWATYTKGNVLGTVLAGIATTAMWGAFASAKIQASQLTKTKKYGEGGSEYLDYGGSHASGNDIDFGTMKDGTRRRVERGEMVAVINKRSVAKYGVNGTRGVIDSLNDGTFNDNYGLAFAGMTATPNGADLGELEKGMRTLVAQGEKKVVQNGDTTIEYYRNRKRIIRS